MTKVSYHPGNGESDETEQFGYSFAGGKPTEMKESDANALANAKFAGNRFFKVHEKKEAKNEDGLNKADADAFNGLADDEKAAYVAE
ncbi:hypothetical protein D3C87_626270 [compost metagenome]